MNVFVVQRGNFTDGYDLHTIWTDIEQAKRYCAGFGRQFMQPAQKLEWRQELDEDEPYHGSWRAEDSDGWMITEMVVLR